MCYRQYFIGHLLYSEYYNIPVYIITYLMFLYLCICLLCTVLCMHNIHTAHVFIVCNSVICTNTFNILAILYNSHIALNYTGNFVVYSPLSSYFIHSGYWTLNIIFFFYCSNSLY